MSRCKQALKVGCKVVIVILVIGNLLTSRDKGRGGEGRRGLGLGGSHPALLEDPHGSCLDGLLRGAWARLLDLLLVAREFGVELLDLFIDGVAALGDLRARKEESI